MTESRDNALREITSIGAGHAATSLSQLTGLTITIDVPRVYITPLDDFAESLQSTGEEWTTIALPVTGEVAGHTYLILSSYSAKRLACLLLRRTDVRTGPLDDLERSSICETANILASSFVGALSELMDLTLMPSYPALTVGRSPGAGTQLADPAIHTRAVCAQTDLSVVGSASDATQHAFFLFVPAPDALPVMFARLGID